MHRPLLLFSLVAFGGLICLSSAWELPKRIDTSEELEMVAARKLMQEKIKAKGSKGKEDSHAPKKLAAAGDGKKSFVSDGSKELVVPKGGIGKLKKEKRVLDEEDDDDIKFMEEEKNLDASHPKQVDSGKVVGKTKDSGKKSKPTRKPAKKSEDAMEIESSEDGDVKKESGAAKDKKPSEKTKSSPAKKSKKPVEKTGEKAGEGLVVEKISDDDSGSGGETAGEKLAAKEPADNLEIEKIDDDREVEEVKEPVKKNRKAEKKVTPVDDDEDDGSADGKKKAELKKVEVIEDEAGVSTEANSGAEALDDEIVPLNIDDGDSKEPEDREEQKGDKKPATRSMNLKELKEPKPSADPKTKTPAKTTTPPEKKSTNSTKKGTDQKKKKTEPAKKEKPLKQEKKGTFEKEHIPISFSGGAVEDVEDFQVGAESDEEDDELNFVDEVTKLPRKFQETAGQVKDTLLPGFQKLSEKSRNYFSNANEQMTQRFAPIVGEQVAPVVASLISYALLLMPLILVLYMLERIRASLSMAKVLFFINIYLGAYFFTLVLATFALHSEPMAFLFRNARSSCVFLQLLQALGYLLYLTLYTVVFFKSCSNAGVLDKLAAGFQWVIVALFGLHYYVTVFHRTMAMKLPKTTWKIYLVYSSAFAVLALFARAKIEPSKKEYYYSPVDDSDELIPVDKRS